MLSSTLRTFFGKFAPYEDNLDKELHKTYNVVKGIYDFSSDGGAVGSYNLKDDYGDAIVIPDNAIITKCYFEILTAFVTTGNNGTIALTIQSAGDLKAATDADTFSGIVAGIPDGAAANMIKLSADRTLIMAIATSAATAGKLACYVEYVLGN